MKHTWFDCIFLGLATFFLTFEFPLFVSIAFSVTTGYVYLWADSSNWKNLFTPLLIALGCVWFNPELNKIILTAMSILWLSYFLTPIYSSRKIPFLKNIVIACIWSGFTLLHEINFTLSVVFFLMVFVLSILIDLGDIDIDPFLTIPKLIGTQKTNYFIVILSVLAAVVSDSIPIAATLLFCIFLQYLVIKKEIRMLRELPFFIFCFS
ncbi:MAG: hypothetical protein ACKO8Q_06495, partial [Bacteroidota bacterium]